MAHAISCGRAFSFVKSQCQLNMDGENKATLLQRVLKSCHSFYILSDIWRKANQQQFAHVMRIIFLERKGKRWAKVKWRKAGQRRNRVTTGEDKSTQSLRAINIERGWSEETHEMSLVSGRELKNKETNKYIYICARDKFQFPNMISIA